MPLSMTWKKNAPSPEVSRTAAGRWNKIFGDRLISSHRHLAVGKLEDLESWCYDEIHGSFTHGVILKKIPPKNPSNATIQGKSPQKKKFTIQICIKFGFSPKKMGNKKWSRTSHPPVFKKKLYIPPNLEEIESFPEKKKNMHNPKATIFDVQQSAVCKSWLVLGNTTLWWHHQRKAFHLNVPYDKTYATRRIQITKLSARFNKDAHHLCFFTLHKLRKRLWSESNYISRIYRSTIIAMFIRIQKKIHIN